MNIRTIRLPNKRKELVELTRHNNTNIIGIINNKTAIIKKNIYEKHEKSTLKLSLHGVISNYRVIRITAYKEYSVLNTNDSQEKLSKAKQLLQEEYILLVEVV